MEMAMAAWKEKKKKEKKNEEEEEEEEVHKLKGKKNSQLGIEFSQFLIGPPLFIIIIIINRPKKTSLPFMNWGEKSILPLLYNRFSQ